VERGTRTDTDTNTDTNTDTDTDTTPKTPTLRKGGEGWGTRKA
jgi:hypothetical protein